MKKILFKSFIVVIFILTMLSCHEKVHVEKVHPVIIAYIGGYRGLVDVEKISPEKITHINYAFVNVENDKAVLTNLNTDSVNFRSLNSLKNKNPELKILISIGGWSWSGNFSDAVLTAQTREIFAQSAVDIMHEYNLDGVDIDWEYPAMEGYEGNIYRPEDKQNYTLMFEILRKKLDLLSETTKKRYLLTTAVGGSSNFINNTEMNKAQQYLDYVNIMTYDYQSDSLAIHHTNLYASVYDTKPHSSDMAVEAYVEAGVPVSKLVLGIAFYGRAYQLEENKGGYVAGDPVVRQIEGKGFSFIKDSLENRNGYIKHWDDMAKAPYLIHADDGLFITYDDEESVSAKCRYTLQKGMAGVMFWEYSSDRKEYLLDEINEELSN